MEKLPPKQKINRNATREELLKLDKNDLVEKIIQLQAHNTQLKNIINKTTPCDGQKQKKVDQREFMFEKCHYRHVLLRVSYLGWEYQGLAVQENTTQTVEYHLFEALKRACLIQSRETSNYHRCGRTDKGVSSFGQVISICLRSKHSPEEQNKPSCIRNEIPYSKLLNRLLPKHIKVIAWMPIPQDRPDYSARFDCKKRSYKYYFPHSGLNLPAMLEACRHMIGSHDFRHLCKMDVGNGVLEFIRRIMNVDIVPVDVNDVDKPTSMYYLLIEGNAFLWHQIRCIMGVLLLIGEEKERPDVVLELLDVEKNRGKPQYSMASDLPLNLFKCAYEIEDTNRWVYEREALITLISDLRTEWTMHAIKTTMIQDYIRELEKVPLASETEDRANDECEQDEIASYAACLLQGVKPKNYTPLMKRPTCSTLHEKIAHYKKRRKIITS